MKSKKTVAWSMMIIWMGVIFFMSHQPGEVSSSQSDLVLKILIFLGLNINDSFVEIATLIIRKSAHFTEYLILFVLAYRVLVFYIKAEQIKWYALALVFIYACSDEIHQYFIPGRGPAFKDVLVDTSGGLFGVLIISIKSRLKKVRISKKDFSH